MTVDIDGKIIVDEDVEKSDAQLLEENRYRETFNPDEKSLNFKRLRATDIKNNPRVQLGEPRPTREEADLKYRGNVIDKVVEEFKRDTKKPSNLTPSELRGIKSLQKRSKAGELIVYPTDKSMKNAVTTPESYKRQGDLHVTGDKIVTWDEVEEAQRCVKGHLRGMNLIFGTGDWRGTWGKSTTKSLESKGVAGDNNPSVVCDTQGP